MLRLSSDELTKQQQNDNKKIFARQFKYFIEMMITAKYWNHSDNQQDSCFIGTMKTRKSLNHRTCFGPKCPYQLGNKCSKETLLNI